MSAAGRALRRVAQLPWRATSALPLVAQARMKLLLGEPPLGPRGFWSAIDPGPIFDQRPSPELLELVLEAARRASDIHVDELIRRAAGSDTAEWVDVYPGEHYRLLAALTSVMQPRLIVEIGTYMGASALAFLDHAGSDTRIVTYDIVPWRQIPGVLVTDDDFADGRLEQRIGDLADEAYWASQVETFRQADLVFLDGPKDGVFEPLILPRLAALAATASFVLVVDDIRFLEMLSAWAAFPSPKIDLTSFGHWSGTGVAMVGTRP